MGSEEEDWADDGQEWQESNGFLLGGVEADEPKDKPKAKQKGKSKGKGGEGRAATTTATATSSSSSSKATTPANPPLMSGLGGLTFDVENMSNGDAAALETFLRAGLAALHGQYHHHRWLNRGPARTLRPRRGQGSREHQAP